MSADVTPIRPPAASEPPAPTKKRKRRGKAALMKWADSVEAGGNVLLVSPARFVTIELAELCTGYTVAAMRAKKMRKEWIEGREYVIAPDKRLLIDLRGFERWAQSRQS